MSLQRGQCVEQLEDSPPPAVAVERLRHPPQLGDALRHVGLGVARVARRSRSTIAARSTSACASASAAR